MSDINGEMQNKKKGLGRGLGSLLQSHGSGTFDETPAPAAKNVEKTAPNVPSKEPLKQASSAPTAAINQTPNSPNSVQAKAATPQTSSAPVAQVANSAQASSAPSAPVQSPVAQAVAPVEPAAATAGTQDKMWMLSIEKLKSGKYQPRKHFDKKSLDELAASIKEHGILQPLVVRAVGQGQFEIIAGERRWRAAQAAGLHEIPAIIKTFDNQKTLELSLIENLQREDLNPIEEAEGYQRLINEFSLTQEKVAEKVGKERATVANALRLLKLAPEVREMVQSAQISQGHAKVLLAITDLSQQKELAKMITAGGLSVRKLEELVQKKISPAKAAEKADQGSESVTKRLISGLADEMQKLLGTRVNIDYANAKGKMSIYFYSDDELTQIIEKLRGARN